MVVLLPKPCNRPRFLYFCYRVKHWCWKLTFRVQIRSDDAPPNHFWLTSCKCNSSFDRDKVIAITIAAAITLHKWHDCELECTYAKALCVYLHKQKLYSSFLVTAWRGFLNDTSVIRVLKEHLLLWTWTRRYKVLTDSYINGSPLLNLCTIIAVHLCRVVHHIILAIHVTNFHQVTCLGIMKSFPPSFYWFSIDNSAHSRVDLGNSRFSCKLV